MVGLRRRLYCLVTCVFVFLGAVLVLPGNVSAPATVVPQPYIFVPNGEGAELLLDSQENLYWLHVISGGVYFRKYNSSHDLVVPDKLLYGNGTNENVDAEWDDFGYIHFTWATDDFGAQSVMYAKIDSNGDFLVAPLKLSGNNTARDFSSAIATNSLGQAYVAWDYWYNPANVWAEDVLYAKIDSDGTMMFTQQYVAPSGWYTDFYGKKDIVVDRDDNLHVIFDRVYNGQSDIEVYYKKYATDGTTVLVSEKKIIPTTYWQFSSSLEAVLDSQDRINIAYSYGTGSPTLGEVFYARIDLQGNLEVGPVMLSQDNDFLSHQAFLVVDENDNSYVFWRETRDGNGEVYYAVVNQNGTVVQGLTRLTYTPEDNGIYYMGAVFDSSDFCIWSYLNATGTLVVIPSAYPLTTIVPGLPRYGFSPTFVTSATPFSFVVSDPNGTGVRGTYYYIDSPPWTNYTLSGPFTVSGEGVHSILYNSTSTWGMPEPTKRFDIVVDDTPPVSLLTTGTPNYTHVFNVWISSSTSIILIAIDDGPIPVGVNYTRYRVWNGGSWTSWGNYSTPFTIGPSEGISHVEAYSSDLLWNNETITNTTFIVDNTPPTTQLYVGVPNYTAANTWVTSSTPIMLSAMDGGLIPVGDSGTFYRTWRNGSWDSWRVYSLPFILGGEGEVHVEYYSVDLLNATETVNNATFVVDDIPPTTQIHVGQPNYTASNTWITSSTPISLTSTDGGISPVGVNRTVYRIWAGSWGPWQDYPAPFTLATEGLNLVEFYSVDLLGNEEVAQVEPLIVDDSPPHSTLLPGLPRYANSDVWVTSSTQFEILSSDDGSPPVGTDYIMYRVWNGEWSPWLSYSSPFSLGQSEGYSYVEYFAVDLVSNQESIVNETFIVDNTPPITSIQPSGTDIDLDEAFALEADDGQGSGVKEILVSVDGGSWHTYTGEFSFGEYGSHTVAFRSVDNLGNSELPKELAFEITEPSENLKPLIALVFAITLLACGLVVSKRRPMQFQAGRSFLKTFLVISLPFCLAEVITGVISLVTGLLAVPPLFGVGMILDMSILLAGLILLAVHGGQEVEQGSGREKEEGTETEPSTEEA